MRTRALAASAAVFLAAAPKEIDQIFGLRSGRGDKSSGHDQGGDGNSTQTAVKGHRGMLQWRQNLKHRVTGVILTLINERRV